MIINHYFIFHHLPCEVRAVLVSLMYIVWLELKLVNVELVVTSFVVLSPPERFPKIRLRSLITSQSIQKVRSLILMSRNCIVYDKILVLYNGIEIYQLLR